MVEVRNLKTGVTTIDIDSRIARTASHFTSVGSAPLLEDPAVRAPATPVAVVGGGMLGSCGIWRQGTCAEVSVLNLVGG